MCQIIAYKCLFLQWKSSFVRLSFIIHVSKVPLMLTCGRHYKHFVTPQRQALVLLAVCLFPSVYSQSASQVELAHFRALLFRKYFVTQKRFLNSAKL